MGRTVGPTEVGNTINTPFQSDLILWTIPGLQAFVSTQYGDS
jgi:hypothetical protein